MRKMIERLPVAKYPDLSLFVKKMIPFDSTGCISLSQTQSHERLSFTATSSCLNPPVFIEFEEIAHYPVIPSIVRLVMYSGEHPVLEISRLTRLV